METKNKFPVAQTILDQLGGNKFVVMTGSNNFAASDNTLSMKLRRNKARATHLIITLEANDLYKLEFIQFRNFQRHTLKEFEGIYHDQLQEIFTRVTGLETTL